MYTELFGPNISWLAFILALKEDIFLSRPLSLWTAEYVCVISRESQEDKYRRKWRSVSVRAEWRRLPPSFKKILTFLCDSCSLYLSACHIQLKENTSRHTESNRKKLKPLDAWGVLDRGVPNQIICITSQSHNKTTTDGLITATNRTWIKQKNVSASLV